MRGIAFKAYRERHVNKLFGPAQFTEMILDESKKQRRSQDPLAFAFLIYDHSNESITRILEDKYYWRALHTLSGNLLDIFYIDFTAIDNSFEEVREEVNHGNKVLRDELSKISDKNIGEYNPAVFFFQIDNNEVIDNLIIELKEDKLEASFLELKNYILEAIIALKNIKAENKDNLIPIMRELKGNVSSRHIRTETITAINKYHLTTVFKSIFKIFIPS